MIYNESPLTLKDGSAALLRSPGPEDAAALMAFLADVSGETDFLLRYPEEWTMSEQTERQLLQNIAASPSSLMILCMADGEIAGNCQLSVMNLLKTRHRGSIAIALRRKFWGKGIGTAMLRALIDRAERMGLRQLELDFVEGNERARALYEKMGFSIVAEKPDAIMLKDGRLLSEFSMIKTLTGKDSP